MSGSYTAFELEAERRQELLQQSLHEAAERRALQGTEQGQRSANEDSSARGLAEFAASLLSRVSQRA